ncbi:TolC family protein [Cyanobium sp. T1B-Tous]|uniref:TolC family protein n=1 Tax=Cyanobium sp. T1B-Tous TaxID=2823721 RepID=UPI0020CD683A|nr:TolC family protein [Cyanobium sp. T1B-Tous]MCP9807349.1 TolC family protein [Cyanobium sp. T1B-Tous]
MIKKWHGIFAMLPVLIAQPLCAQSVYQIEGFSAPQVRPQALTGELEAQLRELQAELDARSKSFTLSQALEMGLLNSPQLAATYAEIQGQQWNLVAVRRQWYPTLSASSEPFVPGRRFGSSTSTLRDDGLPAQGESSSNSAITATNIGLTVGWTFFDPSRGSSINAASENLKRQQLLFDVSARNLVLEIQQVYYNLQEQRLLIEAYGDILKATTRQVQTTEAQFNNGLVNIADVEQIRTQQFATLSTLITAYRQFIDASSRLAQAIAMPPGTLVTPSDGLQALGDWPEPLQPTIEQALNLREEIKASLAEAASARWSATALFNTYWPRFSLGANGQYGNINSDLTQSSQQQVNFTSNELSTSLSGAFGLGFTWQFFDGGINAAQAEVQKALGRRASDQAALDRLIVTREVEQAYTAYKTSQLAMKSSEAQVTSARAAAAAVRARFDVGVSDMSSLVVALNQAINAASNYASSVRDYNGSIAALFRSSARWPANTQPLLNQRVVTLRKQ